MKKIQSRGIGAASDILAAVDFGATGFIVGTGNELLSKLFNDRAEKARAIAIQEIKKCGRSKFDLPDADQFIAIVYRYARAALEGTAELNLKILAKIMKGQAIEGAIYATEFNEFADIVSSLKTREVVYLGTMLRLYSKGNLVQKEDSNDSYDIEQSVMIRMIKQLQGTEHFPEKRDLKACEAGLQRTSLIYPVSQLISGGTIYAPSSDLERLAQLVEFNELLEGIYA